MGKNKELAIEEVVKANKLCPIEDYEFDRAYDSIEPYVKSIIKKSISLSYKIFQKKLATASSIKKDHYFFEQIEIIKTYQKKKGVLVFLSKEVDSLAQLIALLIIPRILGIDTYVVGSYNTWPINILVTLELLGIPDVYRMTDGHVGNLKLGFDPFWSYFWVGSSNTSLQNFIQHIAPPRYGVVVKRNNSKSGVNQKHIKISHPSLNLIEVSVDKSEKSYRELNFKRVDVIYTDEMIYNPLPSSLILGRGFETFWMWPQVNIKDFFVERYYFYTEK